MRIKSICLLLATLTLISGCSTMKLEDYKDTKPPFLVEEYFNGPIKAWGMVQGHGGKVLRRFEIDMVGTWEGNNGTLEEFFRYDDGETQTRTWKIKKLADGTYEGTAGDIVGKADGKSAGSAMQWKYVMDLKVGGRNYHVTFDDWMFQMNDGVLINRSYLKKFGFTVAELTIFMKKMDE